MKPSTLKKLNLIIEEANELKNKNKFQKSIDKFEQALNFINIKVDDPREKRVEINNIKNAVNQTHFVEITYALQKADPFRAQGDYEKVKKIYNEAMQLCVKIDDVELKGDVIDDIQSLLLEIEIEQTIIRGITLRDENQRFEESVEVFKKGLDQAKNLNNEEAKIEYSTKIENEMNNSNELRFNLILSKGTELKQADKLEEALEIFEKSKEFIETTFSTKVKSAEIEKIKNMTNEIYSEKIKPIVEKGKSLTSQNAIEDAVSEFKSALIIADKMFETDLKNVEISLIEEEMNPIFIEQYNPILEEGKKIIESTGFAESITMMNEAADSFYKALDIADKMIESERKEAEIQAIKDLINNTFLPGITRIKDRSIQLIGQQKYEDAINEIYIALSLAKRMTYPEQENTELTDLKNLANKIYLVDIKKVVDTGNNLIEKKEYDKAMETFKEALNQTNKMYFTPEMEKEVNYIKSRIYDVEVGILVGEGKYSEKQKQAEKEIEKLRKRLEYAKSIDDDTRRAEEMSKIKKLIDGVYSEEIRFLVEQGDQLAVKESFDEAFSFYERALKVTDLMEEPDIKNKDLVKESYKKELIHKTLIEIENGLYDIAIENCTKALELDDTFVDAFYNMGLAYSLKKEYDKAIENFQKAIDYDNNHIKSWNLMGIAYETQENQAKALECLKQTIEIDPNFSEGWYNIGNIYKQVNQEDKAIEYYIKATELDSNLARAWFFMGFAYYDKKDYNNAIQNIEKAIELDPTLTQGVSEHIEELKNIMNKLQESLTLAFKSR
ncbi:MAG: tetratricopeptide repeat protein [Promethearchaeota archaeon]|jgi:tetratricopeptide (TPR) repeat protein